MTYTRDDDSEVKLSCPLRVTRNGGVRQKKSQLQFEFTAAGQFLLLGPFLECKLSGKEALTTPESLKISLRVTADWDGKARYAGAARLSTLYALPTLLEPYLSKLTFHISIMSEVEAAAAGGVAGPTVKKSKQK